MKENFFEWRGKFFVPFFVASWRLELANDENELEVWGGGWE